MSAEPGQTVKEMLPGGHVGTTERVRVCSHLSKSAVLFTALMLTAKVPTGMDMLIGIARERGSPIYSRAW